MFVKLQEIAQFKQGKQVDIHNQYEKQDNNMVRFIRIVDYTNPDEKPRYIIDPGKVFHIQKNDIVMIRYGSQTAGKVVRGKAGVIANNLFSIKFKDNINLDYMFYYLSSPKIKQLLTEEQSSSTMPAITFELMKNLKIYLPNESIQNHIVDTI